MERGIEKFLTSFMELSGENGFYSVIFCRSSCHLVFAVAACGSFHAKSITFVVDVLLLISGSNFYSNYFLLMLKTYVHVFVINYYFLY